jgi:hypothetical protein
MTALEYVITSAQEEIARLDLMIENILVDEGPERFVPSPKAKMFLAPTLLPFPIMMNRNSSAYGGVFVVAKSRFR